ncbi:MAG: ribonuclease H-like domain-containing protein [Dehalococcoidia bacterium]|nr:ribonuclease H-like domain-containing protein [Dehalococcoidia bacterium]MDZ4246160.1 ribonuclease H-like domain-containing protein [Dehalococcoidia bacterium]
MPPVVEAYLDIETTGLSPWDNQITVVGIQLCRGEETRFVQLVGKDISGQSILNALGDASMMYTYNGSRFDLPFINSQLGVNLEECFTHRDLMFDCWRCNLYGGFKSVERQMGIGRKLTEVDGREAIRLWWKYVEGGDGKALNTLLEYNREDVENLRVLKNKLAAIEGVSWD